jgi:uncharacterized protein VirK/YbjX
MLDNLSVRPDFNQLLAAQVTLPGKVHRQYLTRGLNASQRARRLSATISSSTHCRRAAGCRHDRRERDALLELQGKMKPASLSRPPRRVKPSAKAKPHVAARWRPDAAGQRHLQRVRQQEQWQLVIGGLQGPRRHVPHEVIKQATRACYGLFPKRLLLEFIWALAAATFRPFTA